MTASVPAPVPTSEPSPSAAAAQAAAVLLPTTRSNHSHALTDGSHHRGTTSSSSSASPASTSPSSMGSSRASPVGRNAFSPSRLPTSAASKALAHPHSARKPSKLASEVLTAASSPSPPPLQPQLQQPPATTPTRASSAVSSNTRSGGQRKKPSVTPIHSKNNFVKDDAFEFNAPRFCDFTKLAELEAQESVGSNPWRDAAVPIAPSAEASKPVDAWFDDHRSSPITGSSTAVADPDALLEQIGDDDLPTPKASKTRPKTAGPSVRHNTEVKPQAHPVSENQRQQRRPATAQPSNAHGGTGTFASSSSITTAENKQQHLARMFANLTLSQKAPSVPGTLSASNKQNQMQRATHDPAVRERLLTGTVASKMKSVNTENNPKGNFNSRTKNQKHKQPTLTVPKPFKFHETSHRFNPMKADETKSPFVPLVNKLKKFEMDTSDRSKVGVPKSASTSTHHRLTKPHSPVLITKQRSKTVSAKTTEEMLMEDIRNYPKFKATQLDRKILKEAHIGVPPPEKLPLTVPKSPAFSKRPVSASVIQPPPNEPAKIIKANPVRNSKPFEVVLEHRQIIPGSVHLPGEEMRKKKMKEFDEALKEHQAEQEKMRNFVARPVPDLSIPDALPEVKPRPTTEPAPFHLLTQSLAPRSAFTTKSDGTFDMNSGELVSGSSSVKFVAQPMPVTEPFVPKKSTKPSTVPEPVVLHTDGRIEERRAFDEARKLREAMEEEMKEIAKLEKEELEKEEVRRLRQEKVFHAQPIRHFPGIQIHASQKRLTEPESPMLKEKRQRLQQMQQMLNKMTGVGDQGNTRDFASENSEFDEEIPEGAFEAAGDEDAADMLG
ncbi:Protein tpx2 [Entophlyctis luteolus]|nr:Protein tpx2 [Entophlyctis luteolus]